MEKKKYLLRAERTQRPAQMFETFATTRIELWKSARAIMKLLDYDRVECWQADTLLLSMIVERS